jgi:hypothetical protein
MASKPDPALKDDCNSDYRVSSPSADSNSTAPYDDHDDVGSAHSVDEEDRSESSDPNPDLITGSNGKYMVTHHVMDCCRHSIDSEKPTGLKIIIKRRPTRRRDSGEVSDTVSISSTEERRKKQKCVAEADRPKRKRSRPRKTEEISKVAPVPMFQVPYYV